jgi:hypothetical protein
MERIGKTKIRGLTIKEKLERTFKSIPYLRRQEGNEGEDGGKEKTISKIFEVYKREAYNDMLKEYKEVYKAINKAKEERFGLLKPMRLGDIKEQPKELLPRK